MTDGLKGACQISTPLLVNLAYLVV